MKAIEILSNSRMIVGHDSGVIVYYDSQHRVTKARMEGGYMQELVEELQGDGSYREQMLVTISSDGERTIMEYPRCQDNARTHTIDTGARFRG